MFKERIHSLTSIHAVRTIELQVDEVDRAIENYESGNPDRDPNPLGRINRSLRTFEYNRKLVERNAIRDRAHLPKVIHEFNKAVGSLSIVDDVTQFRNEEGGTDISVTLYTPLTEFFEDANVDAATESDVGYSVLLRDRMFNPIVQALSSNGRDVNRAVRSGLKYAVGDLRFSANPQEADLTLQVEEKVTDRIGFSRRPFVVKDFKGSSLMLSDVRFFSPAEEAVGSNHIPVFNILDNAVTPYPFPEIREGVPVMCYFEIYNLITGGLVGSYEVTMRVMRDNSIGSVFVKFARLVRGRRGDSVSFSHIQPVERDVEQQLLTVDFSKLDLGSYILEVTVRGRDQNYLSTTTMKPFILR